MSLMSEFSYAASHLLAKRSVRAFEDEGFADFMVTYPGLQYPLYADTKRIATGTSLRRYKSLIDKVNKQVKVSKNRTGTDGYGLGVIDITSHVGNQGQADDDETPPEVDNIRSIVQGLLRKNYSSVSGIVLLWDSYSIMGSPLIYMPDNPTAPRSALIVMVRRNIVIRHKRPLLQLPEDERLFRSEYTVAFRLLGTDCLRFTR